jgi:hypothetical protein
LADPDGGISIPILWSVLPQARLEHFSSADAYFDIAPKLPVRSGILRRDGRGCYLAGLCFPHEFERIKPIINTLVRILENGSQEGIGLLRSAS